MRFALDVANQAENVSLCDCLLLCLLFRLYLEVNRFTKVLLCKFERLRLASCHEQALDGLFSQLYFVEELIRADKTADAFVNLTELLVKLPFKWKA